LGHDASAVIAHGSEILSAEDWDAILEGAELLQFAPNACIVKEGDEQRGIFQLASGFARVEKNGRVVGALVEGSLFGEISFLCNTPASASVFAASESEVTVYFVSTSHLRSLFVRQPALAGRFYCYLAWLLQRRIRSKESKNAAAEDDKEHVEFTVEEISEKKE
jgi:CRP-like cAMP-binding protein